MKLFKNKQKEKELEHLVKHMFCDSNGTSIKYCPYDNRKWCPKTCKYVQNKYKFWSVK